LPFKIVFGIVVEVLPAAFGFVAALVIGAERIEKVVAKVIESVMTTDIRLRIMEPPGPLRRIGYGKV
jgi:ABC-type uncharacterized transport system permease subunit